MEKLVIYSLEGCRYSKASIDKLNKNKIKYELINVDWDSKDKYKNMNKMSTFPQIFYENKKGKRIKIGGDSDLKILLDIINDAKLDKDFNKMIESIKNKLSIDKKTILKIVNLLK